MIKPTSNGRMVDPYSWSTKTFGRVTEVAPLPNLVEIQTLAYEAFLSPEEQAASRDNQGLESLLREIFPIYSYDKTMCLEYVGYDMGRARYTIDECRKLRMTYGYPFKVRLRLVKPEPIEEEVYLGEIPIMIGGGEFIINGSERVIVSQLHRSPGVDFLIDASSIDRKKLHSCWIIPERGSWVELNVTKKDALSVRIDQSGKFSAITFLRALDENLGTDQALLRTFYPTKVVKKTKSQTENAFAKAITDRIAVGDIVVLKTGEVLVPSGMPIPETAALEIAAGDLAEVEVIDAEVQDLDMLIINSLHEDPTVKSHEDALLKIYSRLRPGNPPQLEKARELFHEKFFDVQRYRLGRVGRFRLNRKFDQGIPEDVQVLQPEDIVNSVKYLLALRAGEGEIDDIDNLGNRRVRTIAELAGEEFRKGLLKLRRTAQERMNLENPETVSPRTLINSKTFSSAVDYFFGRSELSQVVDQANPLSQLTHERRLSALGPGGLNRKRAGFDVRDVHLSHYGRLCPIETPEGANIGLISSLALYASLDEYGFLTTPLPRGQEGPHDRRGRSSCAPTRSSAASWLRPTSPVDDKGQASSSSASWRARTATTYEVRARRRRLPRRLAEADRRCFRRAHSVPRARRRQPGADGLEHAAPGGAAAHPGAADRRHGHGEGGRDQLEHADLRQARRHGRVRGWSRHHRRRRRVLADQVPRHERAHDAEPPPGGQRRPRGRGRSAAGRRRRRPTAASSRSARTWWWPS